MKNNRSAHSQLADRSGKIFGLVRRELFRRIGLKQVRRFPFVQEKECPDAANTATTAQRKSGFGALTKSAAVVMPAARASLNKRADAFSPSAPMASSPGKKPR